MSPSTCDIRTISRSKRPYSLWQAIKQAFSLHRQRVQLAQLDDHLLRDIGLTREVAQAETQRPIWDAPTKWRK